MVTANFASKMNRIAFVLTVVGGVISGKYIFEDSIREACEKLKKEESKKSSTNLTPIRVTEIALVEPTRLSKEDKN